MQYCTPGSRLGRRTIILVAINLITLLAGCGSSAAGSPTAPQVPAATRLAQTFQSNDTAATAGLPAEHIQAPDVASSTPSASIQPDERVTAPAGPDPRVKIGCQPPQAAPAGSNIGADVSVDVAVSLAPTERRISPLIYGLAGSSKEADHFRDLGATLMRWGGNQVTRHNWEINASNAGADWEFRNVSYGWPDLAPGAAADTFVKATQAISAAAILTIPTIGYVARDGDNETRSRDVPAQGSPPVEVGSEAVGGYDPTANQQATSVKSYAAKGRPFADPPDLQDGAVYQDEWINHLVKTFGRAEQGGVRFYALDNEPDLWSRTHRDVHPTQMGYDAMLEMFIEYSTAIKNVDPSAIILAPELWGVTSFFFSALDQGDDKFRTHADRTAHDRLPFLTWFLTQVQQHDKKTGRRSLDVLSVHHYPQGGEYPEGSDPETNARRLRSTEQLWNPSYRDESWISGTEGQRLALIPRLRNWVNANYRGTMIGITEWNYGEDDTINGGLTIVDVLGIFGREGLDIASYWRFPQPGTAGASAFKLYGNYDGCGRHFGDQLLTTRSSDQQTLAAYGSHDSHSGDILLMTVNKLPDKAVEARFDLPTIGQRQIMIYQFDAEHTSIRRLLDVQSAGSGFSYTVPPYAATLFIIKG